MLHCLHDSVTFNKSEEKFKITFHCYLAIKNTDAPPSPSKLSTKLICWWILVFVSLNKSVPMSS